MEIILRCSRHGNRILDADMERYGREAGQWNVEPCPECLSEAEEEGKRKGIEEGRNLQAMEDGE